MFKYFTISEIGSLLRKCFFGRIIQKWLKSTVYVHNLKNILNILINRYVVKFKRLSLIIRGNLSLAEQLNQNDIMNV